MNYDHDVLGVGNSSHPANQEELPKVENISPLEIENEMLYLENQQLKRFVKELKELIEYRKEYNKLIIQLCQMAAGENTYIINKLKEIK